MYLIDFGQFLLQFALNFTFWHHIRDTFFVNIFLFLGRVFLVGRILAGSENTIG